MGGMVMSISSARVRGCRHIGICAVVIAVGAWASQSFAATVSLVPDTQTAEPGSSVQVDLLIGGFVFFIGKSFLLIRRLDAKHDPMRFFLAVGAFSGIISLVSHSFFDFNLQIPPGLHRNYSAHNRGEQIDNDTENVNCEIR